jgi:threonine dehydrogenase-like Zn-dependent dehydrogenase
MDRMSHADLGVPACSSSLVWMAILAGECGRALVVSRQRVLPFDHRRVNPTRLTTHTFAVSDLEQAFDTMDRKLNGVIKPLITF